MNEDPFCSACSTSPAYAPGAGRPYVPSTSLTPNSTPSSSNGTVIQYPAQGSQVSPTLGLFGAGSFTFGFGDNGTGTGIAGWGCCGDVGNTTLSIFQQLKDGYSGDTRSVMSPETPAETVGRYAGYVAGLGTSLIPGSSLPSVGEQAGRGNYGMAAVLLATELFGSIGGDARAVLGAEKVLLKDGSKMLTKDALDAATKFLGEGYKEIAPGVFKSADGTKMVRMTENDLSKIDNHAGAPHMNFETGNTVKKTNGKETFVSQQNSHIFLPEEFK